jgi:RHS repeat-associated protein
VSTGVAQSFAHQGLLFDPEIGSYQNRWRQYDSSKRRFAQRDPLGLQSSIKRTSFDSVSHYVYEEGNPISNIDPSGLIPMPGSMWLPSPVPPCPPTSPGNTPGWCQDISTWGHPGDVCYRSYGGPTSAGNQCCYNSHGSYSGGGSVDSIGPAVGRLPGGVCIFEPFHVFGHWIVDVLKLL